MADEAYKILPPLRKKIYRHYLAIVALFGIFGVFFLLSSVFIATGLTPTIIHANYDSIEAARTMQQAWTALNFPGTYPDMTNKQWTDQFKKALNFEMNNITEPGEDRIAKEIKSIWDQWEKGSRSAEFTREMNVQLETLTKINEKGMFSLVRKASNVRRAVVVGVAIFFTLSLFLTLLIVDSLSSRLAKPLKEIAEVLRSKPTPGQKLKLPEPTSLELRILTEEFLLLWERVSQADQMNIERILRQRNQLETLLSSVEDAVIALDSWFRVTHVNHRMAQLIGIDTARIVGYLWNDLPTVSENYFKLREVLRERGTSGTLIFDLKADSGDPRSFEARFKEVFSTSGELISTIFLLHDVTEARQRERLKTEFIGVLSHELKTPLQSLGTAVELVVQKKKELDERTQFLFDIIQSDVTRIRSVANQFVQADYVPGAAIHIHPEAVKLDDLFPEWLRPLELLAAERQIELCFEKETAGDVWAEIDPAKFPWVISNLVTNSIRVSPEGSKVTIILTDRNGYTEIRVTNSGPKIPDEVQRRMFDPYFKGPLINSGADLKTSGYLGLGLTIVKEMTEAHGGRVEYESIEPKGSCFRVLLPRNASEK